MTSDTRRTHVRKNLMTNKDGELRPCSASEREVIMGFPRNYTRQAVSKKGKVSKQELEDIRCS